MCKASARGVCVTYNYLVRSIERYLPLVCEEASMLQLSVVQPVDLHRVRVLLETLARGRPRKIVTQCGRCFAATGLSSRKVGHECKGRVPMATTSGGSEPVLAVVRLRIWMSRRPSMCCRASHWLIMNAASASEAHGGCYGRLLT